MAHVEDVRLYPLKFEPIYKEKVWGGRTLERLGRSLPGDAETKIGESWELADLGQTSASGGGGGAERSKIANGPLAGRTLHELMERFGPLLLGDLQPNAFGEFPLLLKFLDARQNLSVQVHPRPEYAEAHDDAFLKSEAWYIIDAEPGAVIYKGIEEGVTPEQFREAIEKNEVEPLMIKVPVHAGDCHYLPSGTCHALGAGVLVAEVQTPSDTTFRVYDWGRTGRELHVDQAMASMHFGPARTQDNEKLAMLRSNSTTLFRLVSCDYFRIDKVEASAGHAQEVAYDQPVLWMVLRGEAKITSEGGDTDLAAGDTLLIPPAMRGGRFEVAEDTIWLEVSFPQATPTQIA
ncbi:MAG: type I phosphomannose isomerase catalytic subunit [Phycisphaeraceae bacterium]